jgi:carbonic anhydrase
MNVEALYEYCIRASEHEADLISLHHVFSELRGPRPSLLLHSRESLMKKLFHFDSLPEAYVADAAVLCCFDQRIRLATNKFLKWRQILKPDMIVVAGGAKTLASPRNDFERDFILEQVRMSIRLHHTERLLLMSHSDCATYGGLAAFKNDRQAEAMHHKKELQRGMELLKENFPDLTVDPYFVNFEGVWELVDDALPGR